MLVDQFAELFAGNMSAVGTQTGGCRRHQGSDKPRGHWFRQQLEKHLAGTDPCGVYPIRQRHEEHADGYEIWPEVHWGCIDWDEGYDHSWADALNTHNILKAFGITSWIERSRSKGWHLWVFCTEWVPAELMRNALMAACELVDAPTREVNPKQTTLEEGQLGNYVRLPYPNGDNELFHDVPYGEQRYENPHVNVPQTVLCLQVSIFDDVHVPWSPRAWVDKALEQRCTPQQLETLAAMHQPAPTPTSLNVDVPPLDIELPRRITTKLDGVTWLLMNDGPLPDKVTGKIDRSAALFRLGRMLKANEGIDVDEAWQIMVRADTIWGRFMEEERPELLKRTLEKAWT